MLLDGHRHRSPSDPRRPRRRLAVALAVAVPVGVLSAPAASYVTALTAPGSTDWQTTSVEWVRDHGGGPLVDTVENWWYAHNRPTGAVPAAGTLPTDGGAARPAAAQPAAAQPATAQPATAQPATAQPPALPRLAGQPALAHEAEWVPNPDGGAAPALYSAYFRPNADYPSQIVGVAWMNQALTSTHLFAGTAEPVPGTAPAAAQVPHDLRSRLVAVFNSGWKMADSRGGFYTGGKSLVPLQDGAASLVIDTSGRVTVGRWGRDARLGPDVAAVRQNLQLIVDGARPVDGLADNATGAWGSAHNQFQFTWRSGLGTDRSGNLIYVAGDQLTLAGLADAMTAAGVQRGMELDIHPKTVTFTIIHPSHTGLDATKLLPAMVKPTDRYLVPDHRDFLAVTLRTAP
jgi:phosphodiester glycosidase